jgi:hypothetical protein
MSGPAAPLASGSEATPSLSTRGSAVYALTRSFDNLPPDLRLRSADWGVLFAITGRHTVGQIGEQLGLTAAERDRAFARLRAAGLLVERDLALDEYLRAAAASGDPEPRTFAELLRGGIVKPTAKSTPAGPTSSAPARPTAAASPSAAAATRTTPRLAPPPFQPLPLPEPTSMPMNDPSPARGLSLRALMRFIVDRAADVDAGQLDVYRSFIRLDPKLLRQHGITTLRFEDDRVVRDPELLGEIVSSVEQTLGVRCPPDVFV